MISIYINSKGSGDWVCVKSDGEIIHSGHNISPMDLLNIVQTRNRDNIAALFEVTDTEMNELA